MVTKTNLKLAALGGPNTFGGDAAQRLRECYPEFGSIVYFPTEQEAADFANNGADGFCVPQQMTRTGVHPGIQSYIARHGSKLFVVAEIVHAYRCSLLVKPGSKVSSIKRILGHTGSITQSRAWLTQHVPHAEIVIVHTSSQGAAEQVKSDDGSTASVGTSGMAKEHGLEEAAKDIDGGSLGAYWAISPHRLFSENPQRLVVAGRFGEHSNLSGLIGAMAAQGFDLHTTYQVASGRELYEYDYVLRFGGLGLLANVEQALSAFPAARLAGAFEARDSRH